MDKRFLPIITSIFLSFFMIWSILDVMAAQSQQSVPMNTPAPPSTLTEGYDNPSSATQRSLLAQNTDFFLNHIGERIQEQQYPVIADSNSIYLWHDIPYPGEQPLKKLDMLSATDGWAVGDYGTILHWDGSVWEIVPSPVEYNLSDVYMLSPNDGWIVGGWDPVNEDDVSVLLHWNGSAWQEVVSPTALPLNGISMLSSTDGWIVGGNWGNSIILHWNGAQWAVVSSQAPADAFLLDIDMLSTNDGWAVGNYGTILHWNGSQWQLVDSPTALYIIGIDMLTPSYGWAVGGQGTTAETYHWNGISWQLVSVLAANELAGVSIVSENDVWATSYWGHQILHWDGINWAVVYDGLYMNGIDMVSATDGWTVGWYHIMHYEEFKGLEINVTNAAGQPAVHALVEAWDIENHFGNSAFSNSDGTVYLWTPPGDYFVDANSWQDNFFLFEDTVTSPGTITLSTGGASEVTLTALAKDGSPLKQADVVIGNIIGVAALHYPLGSLDSNGVLFFYISPEVYDVGVIDSVNRYLLVESEHYFPAPTSTLDFDMNILPSGEIIAGHPFDPLSLMHIMPWNSFGWPYQFPDLIDGSRIVLSAEQQYNYDQLIERLNYDGNYWGYHFYPRNYDIPYIEPGEVITFSIGSTLNYTARNQGAHVGTWITLTETIDSFGSQLGGVYTRTADHQPWYGSDVAEQIQLTDPNENITYIDWRRYEVPVTATLGLYSIHAEWETGPYQGLLTADSQFMMLPRITSAVIPPEGGLLYSSWDDTLYEFASGTFPDTVIVTHSGRDTDIPAYDPQLGIGHFYDVTAIFSDTGTLAQPSQPYTITIGYTEKQLGQIYEEILRLYNWDGHSWVLEPTSLVLPASNQLIATPDHLSTWGVLTQKNWIFLSLIYR